MARFVSRYDARIVERNACAPERGLPAKKVADLLVAIAERSLLADPRP